MQKLFGDADPKEIEQQENASRTLPVFIATSVSQLANLAQIRDWVAGSGAKLV